VLGSVQVWTNNCFRQGERKAVKFEHHRKSPKWENLASRRKLSRIFALFKAYSAEPAWKPIGDRLQRPHYLSRVDHERKIRIRRQRTDVWKYSLLIRTIVESGDVQYDRGKFPRAQKMENGFAVDATPF